MEIFRTFRLKIGNLILSKRQAALKRKSFYRDISGIKTIGIVWDAEKAADFPTLSGFHQKMNDRNINVKILGYYPAKELPDQYTAIRYLSCIRKNELNLLYIPGSTETDVFINTRFDVLIDINFSSVFPLVYITALSRAFFKVGLFTSENDSTSFDMMMEMKKPVNLKDYLDQIIHYLEMIKAESPAQTINN
jgi:hypothetical protein